MSDNTPDNLPSDERFDFNESGSIIDITGIRIKCSYCKRKIKASDMHWSNGAGDADEVGQPYEHRTKQHINNKSSMGIINICPHCGSAKWRRIKAF